VSDNQNQFSFIIQHIMSVLEVNFVANLKRTGFSALLLKPVLAGLGKFTVIIYVYL